MLIETKSRRDQNTDASTTDLVIYGAGGFAKEVAWLASSHTNYDPVCFVDDDVTAEVELRTGGLTGSELPDIHQLGNPDVSGRDLVTIHIYAPPLGVLKTYKLGSATIEQYTPAEPDFV